MKKSRAWYYGDRHFQVPLSKKRGESITVMGAVGNCVNGVVWRLAPSTNTDDFVLFLDQLKEAQEEHFDGVKPYLVLDNAR